MDPPCLFLKYVGSLFGELLYLTMVFINYNDYISVSEYLTTLVKLSWMESIIMVVFRSCKSVLLVRPYKWYLSLISAFQVSYLIVLVMAGSELCISQPPDYRPLMEPFVLSLVIIMCTCSAMIDFTEIHYTFFYSCFRVYKEEEVHLCPGSLCELCPCYICAEPVDTYRILACNHAIHSACLKRWQQTASVPYCPLCRQINIV